MTRVDPSGGKRPGKAPWAGRRRPAARRSGYRVHPDTTGNELRTVGVGGWELDRGTSVEVVFRFPRTPEGTLLGFGLWYRAPGTTAAELTGFNRPYISTSPAAPDWSKVGSQWYSDGLEPDPIALRLTAGRPKTTIAIYGITAGSIDHPHYREARQALMRNKHQYAPEGNIVAADTPHVEVDGPARIGAGRELRRVADVHLKSCNRCARSLPINLDDERLHLSFTNHCTAPHRVPCRHPGFSRLHYENGDELQTQHGFQLECRFCKKFEVNDPHNGRRTAAQLKEDAARRRAFQRLLTELYAGDDAVLYRHRTGGRELVDDVWERFDRRCFKCGTPFAEPKDMHLDHTRPLALLWPLDETATALCATHNSEKRDRVPAKYYDEDELARLAKIIDLPLQELRDPSPNRDAIARLADRLDWFFDDFLLRPELQMERDGKRPADLLVKALQKALERDSQGPSMNLQALYSKRSGQ